MTQLVNEDAILKYSLDHEIRGIDFEQVPKTRAGEEHQAKNPILASIIRIFDQMTAEQLLLYGVNLYYRYKITSNPDFQAQHAHVRPPRPEEAMALAIGLRERFSQSQYRFSPEVPKILRILTKIVDEGTMKDIYLLLMVFAARLVHDNRGAQWLLTPRSRISVGKGDMAEFLPNIWMIIQDKILQWLTPPQLADLYLSPMSPRNPGEILRRSITSGGNYRQTVLKEIFGRLHGDKAQPVQDDAAIREALRQLVHEYKLEWHQRKMHI